jgi:hypothetical protein
LDTEGNVFGGFTLVEWESRTQLPCSKSDDSLWSCLFTLRNPHSIPQTFALRKETKKASIHCDSDDCAVFGYSDIRVHDNCTTNRESYAEIGTHWKDHTCANNTAFESVFTCAFKFTMKKIEVFKITDETTLPTYVLKEMIVQKDEDRS